MKTLITGLLFVGLTSLGFAQNGGIEQVELNEVNVTPLNLTYLNNVQDTDTPTKVKELENVASRYDITESAVFNKKFEAYEVIFKESNGKIIATYDQNGKITSSLERFSNVVLPPKVRSAIYQSFPGWNLHKDTYLVSYFGDQDVTKVYKIQLRKDKQRKNLKVDVDGNII